MAEAISERRVPVILVFFVVGIAYLAKCDGTFAPADNFLLACGSSQNVTHGGRTYMPDLAQSSFLSTRGSSVVVNSSSSVPAPICQSARVFTGAYSYGFKIAQQGRHWIRLYFYPLSVAGYNSTTASITVVTDSFVLLNNFTFGNRSDALLLKEYAVNVTGDTLTIIFIPSNNSACFVNAIEVVSISDTVFPDQALATSPSAPFSGLSELAFETVYRLNMGGPLIIAQNDTLGRTWENDAKYLHVNSSAVNFSVNPSMIKYPTTMTNEIAPNWVYATADAMGDANVPINNFNITWVFTIDPDFKYFVRAHFCDIVSKSLNTLVFNLYINSDIAIRSLDLSTATGDLEVPYYKDFVANSSNGSNSFTVSVGPDTMADVTNAVMNGLEILKISNEAKSLDGFASVRVLIPDIPSSKSRKIFIITGCAVGAFAALAMISIGLCCRASQKSKTDCQGHPRIPLPLFGNSLTLTKGSTTSHELYQWNGYWYRPRHLEAALMLGSCFKPRLDDVLLTSSMKTGTTWLKALCTRIVTRDTGPCDLLESNHPAHFVKTLEVQIYTEKPPPDLSTMKSPRIFHTHLPYGALPQSVIDCGCKILYIARNPKDTLVSLWHFFNHLREEEGLTPYPFEKAFEAFCEGVTLFGPFFNHVLEYFHKSREHPDRILFLRYEDLKSNPSVEVRRIAEFIGKPLAEDEVAEDTVWRCSLERLKNLEVNRNGVDPWVNMANSSFFRKGIVGDWKNYFTAEMTARIDAITREKLHGSGLAFESEIDSKSNVSKTS